MRGRPRRVNLRELSFYERLWTQTFRGLRDGSPPCQEEVLDGGSMMLIKSARPKTTTLTIYEPGKPERHWSVDTGVVKGQDFRSAERQQAEALMQKEEKRFEDVAAGKKTLRVLREAIPPERHLWEALKRARTAAEVRRICCRSRYWLRWEWTGELNGKRWYCRSPYLCPSALYDQAEAFCRAKEYSRYPKSSRPSSDDKKLAYFACIMSALSLRKPISPATAEDLLRRLRRST
jgi:hypothetical protein